jgi:hypothetical protein
MKKAMALFSVALASLSLVSGCSKAAAIAKMPDIPLNYYACVQTNPDDLEKQFFSHYGNLDYAEQTYEGMIFVFKNITVNQYMLVNKNTFDISTIQCDAMVPGAVADLKAGEKIDLVGVCSGPLPGATAYNESGVFGWLWFTGCIFLPAGTVDLPASGSGSIGLPY